MNTVKWGAHRKHCRAGSTTWNTTSEHSADLHLMAVMSRFEFKPTVVFTFCLSFQNSCIWSPVGEGEGYGLCKQTLRVEVKYEVQQIWVHQHSHLQKECMYRHLGGPKNKTPALFLCI